MNKYEVVAIDAHYKIYLTVIAKDQSEAFRIFLESTKIDFQERYELAIVIRFLGKIPV